MLLWVEALDFLVENLKMHGEEYHRKADARKVKRCEEILEDAISELIARKERATREGNFTLWRKRLRKQQWTK